AGAGFLKRGIDAGKRLHLTLERGEVGDDNEERPEREAVCQDVVRADPEDRGRAERGDQPGAETVQAARERAALVGADRCRRVLLEAPVLPILLGERLYDRDPAQRLLDVRVKVALDLPSQP